MDDDEDVLSAREIEVEVRLRRVQVGTLETVQRNSELLQVPPSYPQIHTRAFSFAMLVPGDLDFVPGGAGR